MPSNPPPTQNHDPFVMEQRAAELRERARRMDLVHHPVAKALLLTEAEDMTRAARKLRQDALAEDDNPHATTEAAAVLPEAEWRDIPDATVWARQFMARLGTKVDEGTMIGWFANAFAAGERTAEKMDADKIAESESEYDKLPHGYADGGVMQGGDSEPVTPDQQIKWGLDYWKQQAAKLPSIPVITLGDASALAALVRACRDIRPSLNVIADSRAFSPELAAAMRHLTKHIDGCSGITL